MTSPAYTGVLIDHGNSAVGWLTDSAGCRIDLRAEVVEVDGVRRFALTGDLGYVPAELRVPGDAGWGE